MIVPACQSGIDPREFWSLTLLEIKSKLEAYNRQLQFEVELNKQTAYTTAIFTAQFVGLSLGGKPLPSYEQCFGIDTSTGTTVEDRRKQEVEFYKQQWSAFAIEHNRRRKLKNGG